ncbi:HIT family hydrolase [Candidatus Mycoplasma haematobovis]|uniref:HIT family hydrolase n=1 Tax=Candidatus Mycoplasma haematobovis TaxID=432608 RepID=A0A1A9QF96_9MOLU|nr:HIT domain-containing protein [Candidatus Mycoplasma haematobovis]OAL10814.1 HIT family hydrolase [Candidatus Mycoplasma haematobovis]
MCKKEGCVFCEIASKLPDNILGESKYAYALPDHKPITEGHTLIITKDHYENFMNVESEAIKDASVLAQETAKKLLSMYPNIQGINYVSNQGAKAKQVVFHFHLHIIPKY